MPSPRTNNISTARVVVSTVLFAPTLLIVSTTSLSTMLRCWSKAWAVRHASANRTKTPAEASTHMSGMCGAGSLCSFCSLACPLLFSALLDTNVQAAAQLAVATHLHAHHLVQRQAHKIDRLTDLSC